MNLTKAQISKLWKAAKAAQKKAYAPYSRYFVGASVLAGGKVYSGANVENASYGGTICAERFAVGKAANEGQRKITAVCVVTQTKGGGPPCGLCLQVLAEFVSPETPVMVTTAQKIEYIVPFSDLLGTPFNQKKLYSKTKK